MKDIYENELEYASVEAFEKAHPALAGALRKAVREELEIAQANGISQRDQRFVCVNWLPIHYAFTSLLAVAGGAIIASTAALYLLNNRKPLN